jgi:hypothetical protein
MKKVIFLRTIMGLSLVMPCLAQSLWASVTLPTAQSPITCTGQITPYPDANKPFSVTISSVGGGYQVSSAGVSGKNLVMKLTAQSATSVSMSDAHGLPILGDWAGSYLTLNDDGTGTLENDDGLNSIASKYTLSDCKPQSSN